MRYYIADCHFFGGTLNEKMDRRGFSGEEEMNEYMIMQWNKKVRPRDEVVILGDFSMAKGEKTNAVLQRLHGRLYLIEGNHDYYLSDPAFDKNRFVWIKPYGEMRDAKRKVVLCHYPVFCYNGQYRKDEQGNPKTYMLYGHVHDSLDERLVTSFQEQTRKTERTDFKTGRKIQIPCNMINCFCMYSDYEPLTLDEWIALDRVRREKMKNENEDETERISADGGTQRG